MFGTYRTFLALLVVALHLGGIHVIGVYAVFGFYTLSGYLMTLIMQTNYGYTLSGVYKYTLNRFLRIYPMYWVSIAFSAVLVYFVGESFSTDYHKSIYFPQNFSELIKNILLFFPYRESPRLTPPAWALTVEIFFYILIGLGISKNKKIVLAWLFVSVIYHVVATYLGLGWDYRYFTVFAASLPFATGAFIYHYKSRLLTYVGKVGGKLGEFLPFVIVFLILLNWLVGRLIDDARDLFFYINYILCACMVIALAERRALPYISKRLDKWIGDFSYPIYLIHFQVGMLVVLFLGMLGFSYKGPEVIVMIISLPFIFLFSYIFTVAIEQPIELIRAKIKKGSSANESVKGNLSRS